MAKRLLSLAVLVSASALAATGGASANQGGTGGCSAGFEYISLAQLAGSRPAAIETDQAGNNDGWVCRRLLGKGLLHRYPGSLDDTVYLWLDNAEPHNT